MEMTPPKNTVMPWKKKVEKTLHIKYFIYQSDLTDTFAQSFAHFLLLLASESNVTCCQKDLGIL